MTTTTNSYQLLIRKLDSFIRKFYLNQFVRGTIYTGTLILAAFILVDVLEYFFYFSSGIRSVLFYGFLAAAAYTFLRFVGLPLLHYFQLGKIISHEKAASIIGRHFREVEDRLLNILQLNKQMNSEADTSLIEASINQKTKALQPVPFSNAVNISLNRKYLKYLALPMGVLVFILLASPSIIKDGTYRLIHHGEYFERQAPFRFSIVNQNLETVQYKDFQLQIKIDGSLLPSDGFIHINGFDYPLSKKNTSEYSYLFVKPQQNIDFYLQSGGFRSQDYQLKVLAKPIIASFKTDISYPAYTGIKNEVLQNIGDLTVPEGTIIKWQMGTQNVSAIQFDLGDNLLNAEKTGSQQFLFSARMKKDVGYTLFLSSPDLPKADSVHYGITVIPDRYPAISVSQVNDSANKNYLYFLGETSDDYGVKNVYFKYQITHDGDNAEEKYISVPIQAGSGKQLRFTHFFDMNSIHLAPGDRLTYFFEVWDNDGVNGSKSSRSSFMTYNMPSAEEMEKKTDENNEKIEKDLQSSMTEAQSLKDEFEKMQNDLLNKKNPTWEDQKKLQDLMQRQQDLNKKIEDIQKTFKENNDNQQGYTQYDDQLVQKQQDLQKLMDDVLTPEMKEMMQKLQDLLQQMDKDKTLNQLQDQKLSNDELQKSLDRMLSLFKQLQFEQKFNDTQSKLDSLAKKQDDLSNETNEKKQSNDSLGNKQSDIQKQFEDVKKDLDSLAKMNQDLDQPNEMPDMQQEQEQTDQEMKDAQQNLQKNDNSKAGQNQKSASQQMKKMSEQMQQSMQSMQMQQNEMDMQAVRQILENLLTVSFDQEDLLSKTKGANIYNPHYLDLMKDEKKIQDDLQMVEDSIQELSKRVFEIQSFANEQIGIINKNMEQSLTNLEGRQPGVASSNQQYIMTSVNNLALMFNEVLQQMQQQQSSMMQGTQMCQKPGGKKNNLSSLRQMQQQLNDRMDKLGQQMKDGKMPQGQGGMSKELAQMAAQQSAIRQALQELNDQMNKDGKGTLGDMGELQKQMEQTETQLLNKQLTEEMQKRQQEILTRLLDAENAERQRETDNKRESTTGKDIQKNVPPEIEEYLKKKQAELELYKTVPPDLKPFYKSLVEDYYKQLQK